MFFLSEWPLDLKAMVAILMNLLAHNRVQGHVCFGKSGLNGIPTRLGDVNEHAGLALVAKEHLSIVNSTARS